MPRGAFFSAIGGWRQPEVIHRYSPLFTVIGQPGALGTPKAQNHADSRTPVLRGEAAFEGIAARRVLGSNGVPSEDTLSCLD
jgi:hypothetical protein